MIEPTKSLFLLWLCFIWKSHFNPQQSGISSNQLFACNRNFSSKKMLMFYRLSENECGCVGFRPTHWSTSLNEDAHICVMLGGELAHIQCFMRGFMLCMPLKGLIVLCCVCVFQFKILCERNMEVALFRFEWFDLRVRRNDLHNWIIIMQIKVFWKTSHPMLCSVFLPGFNVCRR